MTKVILLTAAMLLIASLAIGQVGFVGTYADPSGLDCNVLARSDQDVVTVYMVHQFQVGATRVFFQAARPPCLNAVWLQDDVVFSNNTIGQTLGISQTGVTVDYGACLAGPVHVLTVSYITLGSTAPCCEYPTTMVQITDCANNTVAVGDAIHTINGDGTCPCNSPVPVEETTWGQMKALYN